MDGSGTAMKHGLPVMAFAAAMSLSACSGRVPHVEDPYNPVDADGNVIKGTEFLQRYCQEQASDETCQKVRQVVISDAAQHGLSTGGR